MKNALIIFVRNPEPGKVKTRLAKTMGNEKALQVYLELLEHTHNITQHLNCAKFVFYTDHITRYDLWENNGYHKKVQQGNELGERMLHAFTQLFDHGYEQVIIIGSDCYELTAAIIESGFEQLQQHDTVIGPSTDGGYYLLGLKQAIEKIFVHKQWSTETVYRDTMEDMIALNLSAFQLPVLSDVDSEADWIEIQEKRKLQIP